MNILVLKADRYLVVNFLQQFMQRDTVLLQKLLIFDLRDQKQRFGDAF